MPPFFQPRPSGFLQAPSRRPDFSKVGKESKNQDDGRRLCKAGHLPLLPDWLVSALAGRIGITCLSLLLLTGPAHTMNSTSNMEQQRNARLNEDALLEASRSLTLANGSRCHLAGTYCRVGTCTS